MADTPVTVTKHKHCCPTCDDTIEAIRLRNESTKVWIQSDIQTRAYCHQLERELEALNEKYKQLERRHHDNLCRWEVKEREFVTSMELTVSASVKDIKQTWVESLFWASNDDGATWGRVPCTGSNWFEALRTLLTYLATYDVIVPSSKLEKYRRTHGDNV